MGGNDGTAESAWAPLSHPVFRALWIASLISKVGTWMQNVGAAWAMTSLSPSPLMVALVQSATSLPVLLVGLPAGAVADIVDRRRLLLVTQTWMLAATALLAVLAFADVMTATLLLALTFALGIGVGVRVRTGVFLVGPRAFWAFPPFVARGAPGLGALGSGLLLGCFGLGAIAGAAFLPGLKRRPGVAAVAPPPTIVSALVSAVTA